VTRYAHQLRCEKAALRESRMLTRPGPKPLQAGKTSGGAYSKVHVEHSTTAYDEESNSYEQHPTVPYKPGSRASEQHPKGGSSTSEKSREVSEAESGITEPHASHGPVIEQRRDV
jgi:hypothetical protein